MAPGSTGGSPIESRIHGTDSKQGSQRRSSNSRLKNISDKVGTKI